eukprot:SAG11_NODE_12521_length_699_cov_0.833333_1_plen_83_part_10
MDTSSLHMTPTHHEKGEVGGFKDRASKSSAYKVPYVDPPQHNGNDINAIRHAQVPGKIAMYNRRYRPKICTRTFSICCRYWVR